MITFFTTHYKLSLPLLNSLESWERLSCVNEVFIFSNTITNDELARHSKKAKILPSNENPNKPPTVKALFKDALENTDNGFLCYLNSDILLLSDFCDAFHKCKSKWSNFQMIGQRTNWMDNDWVRFDKDVSDEKIKKRIREGNSKLHPRSGIDYFCFNRETYSTQIDEMPNFLVARTKFDHYLAYAPRRVGAEVVDCTNKVYCIHHEENINSRRNDWNSKPSFAKECDNNNKMYLEACNRDKIQVISIDDARTCEL